MFDLNVSNDIVTLEGVKRGKPGGRILVTLLFVNSVGDGNQLGLSEVVGEFFALSGGPIAGSANPGFLQWNQMVLHLKRVLILKFEVGCRSLTMPMLEADFEGTPL